MIKNRNRNRCEGLFFSGQWILILCIVFIKRNVQKKQTFPAKGHQAQAEHWEVFGKVVLDSPKMYAIIRGNQEGRPHKEQ